MANISSLSIENLKKVVEKKQKDEKQYNLSKGFKINIDKYTKIDELLRDLIKETHITNKILVALYIQEAADGSMVAKDPTGVDTSAILKGLRGVDDYRTLNPIFNNIKIEGSSKEIFNVKGSGIIDVIKFISSTSTVNNKDYSVRIRGNNTILYQNSWTELESRTPNERGMVCFEDEDNNEYVLIFKTIAYSESFKIEIYDSNATLDMIQVKYHERV